MLERRKLWLGKGLRKKEKKGKASKVILGRDRAWLRRVFQGFRMEGGRKRLKKRSRMEGWIEK